MEKTCFVIMPIADTPTYPVGHFKRVYEYIIKPAAELAGFKALRADGVINTNYIAIDIIKRIVESDMAICDLSAKNANVFYELGIRQAFDKPVTLIKDAITGRAFDIQGFRDIEYDENLRVDNIKPTIELIAETLQNTYDSHKKEVNSLVSLLGVSAAKVSDKIEISSDTQIIPESIQSLHSRLNSIEKSTAPRQLLGYYPLKDFEVGSEMSSKEIIELKVGDKIEHYKFGICTVSKVATPGANPILEVILDSGDKKKILINYARLRRASS